MPPARLDAAEELEVYCQFPALPDLLAGGHPDSYEYRAISIFDSWIGKERLDELYTVSDAEFAVRSAPLGRFSDLLLRDTTALGIAVHGPLDATSPLIFSFSSPAEAQRYARPCSRNATSDEFFRLLLPELEAVFLESWDFTNVFFLQNLVHLPQINRFAAEAGIYVLEKNW